MNGFVRSDIISLLIQLAPGPHRQLDIPVVSRYYFISAVDMVLNSGAYVGSPKKKAVSLEGLGQSELFINSTVKYCVYLKLKYQRLQNIKT